VVQTVSDKGRDLHSEQEVGSILQIEKYTVTSSLVIQRVSGTGTVSCMLLFTTYKGDQTKGVLLNTNVLTWTSWHCFLNESPTDSGWTTPGEYTSGLNLIGKKKIVFGKSKTYRYRVFAVHKGTIIQGR
jgi:hypothetical protein